MTEPTAEREPPADFAQLIVIRVQRERAAWQREQRLETTQLIIVVVVLIALAALWQAAPALIGLQRLMSFNGGGFRGVVVIVLLLVGVHQLLQRFKRLAGVDKRIKKTPTDRGLRS